MSKLEKIYEELSTLTVLEIAELSKMLEEKWGVKATVAVAAGPVAGATASAEAQTEFTVTLESFGNNKIAVIKEIRAITSLGLKEAKDLVEGAPKTIKEGVNKKEAEEIKTKLEATGAKVKIS